MEYSCIHSKWCKTFRVYFNSTFNLYTVSRCLTRGESEDHTSKKACKKQSTLALKPRADVTRSPKQGYQWPHKKDLCPSEIFKKNKAAKVLATCLSNGQDQDLLKMLFWNYLCVTSISLYQLVLLNALQLAAGATSLFSQGVTAVVHGCSVRALGPRVNLTHSWRGGKRCHLWLSR